MNRAVFSKVIYSICTAFVLFFLVACASESVKPIKSSDDDASVDLLKEVSKQESRYDRYPEYRQPLPYR